MGGQEDLQTLLVSLAADLSQSESGLSFIYQTLDAVSGREGWTDAVVVLDDPRLGRQFFRVDRRPPQESSLFERVNGGAPSLHAEPGPVEPCVSETVASLCAVALQMDLLRHDASHDGLTGLFNRRSFDSQLAQAAARSERYGWSFVLALIDLDHFKAVNDRYGHEGGDSVLRTVGMELRNSLRTGDVAARLGGDEFALVLANGDQDLVDTIIGRVERATGSILEGTGVGFSSGVATAPAETTDLGELYRLADARLYEAKRR
ncbi:MAG: GGDEF domain-containing protein [Actinomycetota bacterium]|nr:GGDEF domain-containing protein [Actinomycetota bacterium]